MAEFLLGRIDKFADIAPLALMIGFTAYALRELARAAAVPAATPASETPARSEASGQKRRPVPAAAA